MTGGHLGLTNDEVEWDDFDPVWYADHNYKKLQEDDTEILHEMRDFFGSVDRSRIKVGLDVGTGANLYPALAMLPLCRQITLWERSASNVDWLTHELRSYSPFWDAYWRVLARGAPYEHARNPRTQLGHPARTRIVKESIFNLPRARWDIGTMLFVAESISTDPQEFKLATHRFLRSLRAGAPFAAVFMRNSRGYHVGNRAFPAVAVDEYDVGTCLAGFARDVKLITIKKVADRREGYDGMILAIGKAA